MSESMNECRGKRSLKPGTLQKTALTTICLRDSSSEVGKRDLPKSNSALKSSGELVKIQIPALLPELQAQKIWAGGPGV